MNENNELKNLINSIVLKVKTKYQPLLSMVPRDERELKIYSMKIVDAILDIDYEIKKAIKTKDDTEAIIKELEKIKNELIQKLVEVLSK